MKPVGMFILLFRACIIYHRAALTVNDGILCVNEELANIRMSSMSLKSIRMICIVLTMRHVNDSPYRSAYFGRSLYAYNQIGDLAGDTIARHGDIEKY